MDVAGIGPFPVRSTYTWTVPSKYFCTACLPAITSGDGSDLLPIFIFQRGDHEPLCLLVQPTRVVAYSITERPSPRAAVLDCSAVKTRSPRSTSIDGVVN